MYQQENQRPHSGHSEKSVVAAFVWRYALGLCGCMLICWLLLCIVAKVMCLIDLPLGWIVPITTCCGSAAALLGALLAVRKIGQNGAIWGCLLALGSWVILCLCGLTQGQTFTALSLLKLLAFVCAGMIGGILGALLQQKRKKKLRRGK